MGRAFRLLNRGSSPHPLRSPASARRAKSRRPNVWARRAGNGTFSRRCAAYPRYLRLLRWQRSDVPTRPWVPSRRAACMSSRWGAASRPTRYFSLMTARHGSLRANSTHSVGLVPIYWSTSPLTAAPSGTTCQRAANRHFLVSTGHRRRAWAVDEGIQGLIRVTPDGRYTQFRDVWAFTIDPLTIIAGPDGRIWLGDRALGTGGSGSELLIQDGQ